MKEIENVVMNIICEEAEFTEVNREANFGDIGIDSLTFIKFVVRVEEHFGIEFSDDDLVSDKLETVVQVARRIVEIKSSMY